MAFNKVILFAAFAACFLALASALTPLGGEMRPVNGPNGPAGPAGIIPSEPAPVNADPHARNKKFAYFSSYAYSYPSFYSYPYSSYSYSYSKPYYHPYAYGSFYPGFHYY